MRGGRGPAGLGIALSLLGLASQVAGVEAQDAALPLVRTAAVAKGTPSPDTPPSLTVAEAARLALEHDPALRRDRARAEAERAAADQARAERWPDVSLSAALLQHEEPMIVAPIHGFQPGTTPPFDRTLYRGLLRLDYDLWDGGRREARIEAARSGHRRVEDAAAGTRLALLDRVASVYLEILAGAAVVEAHDLRSESLEGELERLREAFEVGGAARIDVLRIQAELARARADRTDVASRLDVLERCLARLLGIDPARTRAAGLAPVQLAEVTEDPVEERTELTAGALSASPLLDAARHAAEASQARVRIARGVRLPQVGLAADWTAFGAREEDPVAEWTLDLRVSVPVFTGGELSRSIEAAEARLRADRHEVERIRTEIEDRTDEALARITAAAARARSLEEAVERAAEVRRIEELRLEVGRGVLTDFLDAEARLMDARARLAEARAREAASHVQLARIRGVLSPDWLTRHLETPR